MENATKALIMAGAILVAILLISTGIIILRSTKGVEQQVGTVSDSMAATTFNAQFTQYLGSNVPAVQVKSLASILKANNTKNSQHKVTLTYTRNSTYTANFINQMDWVLNHVESPYYIVKVEEFDTNGYIKRLSAAPTT